MNRRRRACLLACLLASALGDAPHAEQADPDKPPGEQAASGGRIIVDTSDDLGQI